MWRLYWPLLLGALTGVPTLAQEPAPIPTNQRTWVSATVRGGLPGPLYRALPANIADRIRLEGEFGYRSGEGFISGQQVFTDLGGRYRINKYFAVGTEFRYAHRFGRTDRQRLGVQLHARKSFGRANLAYRLNYQHNFRPWGRIREVVRNRFEVEYDFPKWKLDPVVSLEQFTWIGHRGVVPIGVRWKVGTAYRINKAQRLTLTFALDRDRGLRMPEDHTIIAFGWVYDLRR